MYIYTHIYTLMHAQMHGLYHACILTCMYTLVYTYLDWIEFKKTAIYELITLGMQVTLEWEKQKYKKESF